MEFLSNMFASVLSYFYSIFHNYGVSVIVVTFLIKVVLSPLNIKQYVINNITEIVEKEVAASVSFGEQQYTPKEKKILVNKEKKELLKKYNLSQTGSCLFSLTNTVVQLIILFSFYTVIRVNTKISDESLLWFKLGTKDSLFLLPLITGFVTLVYFYFNSKFSHKKKSAYILGAIISLLIIALGFKLPSIIYVYWITSNIITIIIIIYSHIRTNHIQNLKLKKG